MRSGTIPSLISPYVRSFNEASLVLVSYVLGASANWLLLRFLAAATAASNNDDDDGHDANVQPSEKPGGVILLSFLRDYAFWRDSARRLGVDVTKLAAQNRFICVDGLSELYSVKAGSKQTSSKPAVRGDHVALRDAKLESVETAILELIDRMNKRPGGHMFDNANGKTLLIVDGLDFLMAATEENAHKIMDTVFKWRENAHKVIITISADSPLIHAQTTPIERNHRELAVGLTHMSEAIMGCRLLDTGTARDISGVLRISRGAFAEDDVEENEFLYLVSGDGQAKVFTRGASS